jgi:ribonucleoside-diphosphate reductase alpha subunit
MSEMRVTKRDGTLTIVEFDKILRRIRILGAEANLKINYTSLAMKVIDQLYDGISTTKIDELSAEQCASLSSSNLDYNVLAGRIVVSNHQKNTNPSFTYVMHSLYNFTDKHEKRSPLVSEDLYQLTLTNGAELDAICDYSRDYAIDYFGFKTLERAYLMKIHGKSVERPQHMWLRVAIGIHGTNMERIKETYKYMSLKYFTHATPTLFNAGTPHPQLSSCFLEAMESDSVDGIYNTLKDCAQISKWAGGIGLHIHNVRASGSHIRGTNGRSNGIVPMLKVFNNTAKYIDQCVHPETIIYTTQGPKQIQYCTVGETAIYNSKGETEVIQDLLEHSYEGEFLEIDTGCNLLRITPMHPVCTMRKNSDSVEWVDAGDLIVGDRMVFAVPKWSADISEITAEDCYMYGYLHKFASFTIDSMTGFVAVDNAKRASIGQYFTDRLVKFDTTREDDNMSIIKWKYAVHLPFRCRSDFTDETGHKHLHHRWLNLPIEKSKHILRGLLEDDDYQFSTRQIQKRETSSTIGLVVSESGFAESVRFLCLKMGFIANIVAENDMWIVKIAKNPEICELLGMDFVEKDNGNSILLTEITNITTTTYSGILYDLQMKNQHDYLIHNGLVHNGGGRRNGSFAIYLEPWHADVELFLQMRKNHGDEELKARDLFYAMWIPDLFMERVKANGKWTLMCPDECPGLADVYGEKFVALYTKYEEAGKGRRSVNARDIWFQILDAQMETGTPYILFKDACNEKSNQKNLGTIKSSNLCTEIIQYSDEHETAVCNLASIALPTFVSEDGVMDYEELHKVAKIVIYNLNRVIDVNYYPIPKTRTSNLKNRPTGLGVQGLSCCFAIMNIPFHSDSAKEINKKIFETLYHAALEQSCDLAIIDGPYETFAGSPASKGILQFDMWNVAPGNSRYDWDAMKERIKKHGLRNSLLLAPMPTASTSQILGFNECIEPYTSNIYNRRTMAGEFIMTNKYLMKDLTALGLWNDKLKNNIIANNGSVQQIESIPQEIRDKYKTVWELPMKHLIDMSADRGAFICQSQSLNLWLEDPNYNTLTSMHFYSWSKGLKTGIYYLRRRARHQAQKFTIEPEKKQHTTSGDQEENHECEMCGA